MFYPVAKCLSYQREGRTGTEAGLWVKTDRDDNPGEGRLHRVRTGNCYRGILTILSGRLHVLPCCKMSIVPDRKENQNIKHESAQSLRQLIAPSLSGVLPNSAQASSSTYLGHPVHSVNAMPGRSACSTLLQKADLTRGERDSEQNASLLLEPAQVDRLRQESTTGAL